MGRSLSKMQLTEFGLHPRFCAGGMDSLFPANIRPISSVSCMFGVFFFSLGFGCFGGFSYFFCA